MNTLTTILALLLILWVTPLKASSTEPGSDDRNIFIKGQLGLSTIYYDVDGRPSNRKPFSWFITGNPTLVIYGIEFPFHFSISEQERSFRQPLNRFGASPKYKWATLHLGYRNIYYSPYSLGGHTIAGAGVDLNPGNFRFGFMYGRLLRPVDTYPPVNLDFRESFFPTPSYKRNGWGTRVGYGTNENYTDLIFFRGRDVPGSITGPEFPPNLTPAENAILAISSKQKLMEGLFWEFEIAQSLYTMDQEASPHGVRDVTLFRSLEFLSAPNQSSRENMAIESSLNYRTSNFQLTGRYKRIDPDYLSMGTWYQQSDLRNITIEPSVFLWEQKINLSASAGWQKDNLKENQVNQTNRFISSISLAFVPASFYQLQLTHSNYNLNQKEGLLPLDELNQISQTTKDWQVMQSINHTGELFNHQLTGAVNYQQLKDRNVNTSSMYDYRINQLNLLYSLYYIPLFSGLQAGYSRMALVTEFAESRYQGPQAGLSAQLLKNALSLSILHSRYRQEMNDEPYGSYITTRLRAGYNIKRVHRIGVSLYINKSTSLDKVLNPMEYNELKVDFNYAVTF